jgi:hypothetical protein
MRGKDEDRVGGDAAGAKHGRIPPGNHQKIESGLGQMFPWLVVLCEAPGKSQRWISCLREPRADVHLCPPAPHPVTSPH